MCTALAYYPLLKGILWNSEHSAALKTATKHAGKRVVTASSYVCVVTEIGTKGSEMSELISMLN
jgi:hypothetical protein